MIERFTKSMQWRGWSKTCNPLKKKVSSSGVKFPTVRVSDIARRKIIVLNIIGLFCDIQTLHNRREWGPYLMVHYERDLNVNPLVPPSQGPPAPHLSRITPIPTTTSHHKERTHYLCSCFQFHSMCKLFLLQKTFLAPQVLSKPSIKAIAEKLLISICLIICFHATFAYMMSSSQMQCLTLDSYHDLRLKILLLHSNQMVQRVMPQRRCQILICLQNFF